MFELTDTITFEVDFNDLDESGRLLASMRYASGATRFPQPGERVLAHDSEGNWCEGVVYSYAGLGVTITLDRDTWERRHTTIANPYASGIISPEPQDTKGIDPKLVPAVSG
jgi:hypothetical protein